MMTSRFSHIALVVTLCFSLASVSHAGILDFFKKDGVHLVVIDPFVEMHTGPGRGYPVFHVIEKGENLHLFKRKNDWFKTRTEDGVVGWVKRSELIKTLGPDGSEVDFSAPDWQDYVDRRWEFGVLGGNFDEADAFTTYLAFHLTQHISAEMKYTQTFSSVGNNKLLSFNAVHKPFPNWKVSPFFLLGTGRVDISPNSTLVQSEDRENPVLTVGGGAVIYVSRRFLLRLEFNNHTFLTKREENEEVDEWKAGFSVFF